MLARKQLFTIGEHPANPLIPSVCEAPCFPVGGGDTRIAILCDIDITLMVNLIINPKPYRSPMVSRPFPRTP